MNSFLKKERRDTKLKRPPKDTILALKFYSMKRRFDLCSDECRFSKTKKYIIDGILETIVFITGTTFFMQY